ncbi:hypothetical protein [Streptomyces sp. BE133]|uniref:hypothetical protein n=1 Tax=Streptomyces sp. BE133 TaxID=3002523 RepID=UPI002E768C3F|nr:hypothetical protein [Streptomyces sp. BE133]MEE1810899.1 hypothetical protein [Streptomyces sp. BE133]
MKRERSSEESESGNGRGGASGGTVPDSSEGTVPGSIGAPSAPSSRTVTEGGDTSVTGGKDGGGARTPTSSKSVPEEAGEPAAQTPAVVHAAGVSIGRTTSEPEGQPGGEDSAVAQEEAAPTAGKTAVVATTTTATTTAAGTASAASSGVAESTAGKTAEASTSSSATAAAESTPAGGPSGSEETASTETASTATEPAVAASTAGSTAAAVAAGRATATAAVSAAASSSPPGGGAAGEGGAPERPGRVSRPMVVAAAFAGALLLATPFVVAGAQKDEAKPESREAAAAWKEDGRAGGYVPGTDPDSPEGKRAAGGDKRGVTPARGDKGPVGDVRADTGDGRKPADGSAEAETKGAKGAKGAKGSTTGAADKTEKSGSGDKAPAGTGSDTPTKAPSAGSAPKSAPAVVYSGVSGPECPTQRFQKSGYYSDGKEGWATHSGGFGGYGCAGKYLSMPMSGSSSKDSGGSATWLFDLPDTARKCSISVHVPGSSDIARVGGNPSYYTVYDRFLPRTSNLVGSYYVRQQERRGTWYNVPGTFPVDAKKLSVQLHDRGEDNNYEHHAISALKVTCTG